MQLIYKLKSWFFEKKSNSKRQGNAKYTQSEMIGGIPQKWKRLRGSREINWFTLCE